MENNILPKEEILELVNIHKDHFTQMFRSKACSYLYKSTMNFIERNYTGDKFTEKVYKYIYGEKYCKQCNQLLSSKTFRSFFDGYCGEYCSKSCAYKSNERTNNIKLTKKEKYGNEAYNNLDKLKQTNLKKYGTEHNWSKNSSNREQCYITNEKRHGNRNWNNSKKSTKTKIQNGSYKKQKETLNKTCKERYNTEFYVMTDDFKNKFKKHFLITYGVEHPSHVPEFFEKGQYKWKSYTLPTGKIIKIQGYENLALDILLKENKESDVITSKKDMPTIWYFKNNTKHRYYPDIFLPKQNKFVEVKSEYTFSSKKEESMIKQQSVKTYGFLHEIWIFNKNHELISKI